MSAQKSSPGPTISIVTACYNSTPFLDRIHRSLQAQTYRNFEWVCVDDCSTDDTVDRLLALESPGDLGMQVYRLPQNTGGGVALAVGTAKALGDLVIWLDHDDELFPEALAEVARNWPRMMKSEELVGLFFQAVDPQSGRPIGGSIDDHRLMTMQQFNRRYPKACDGTLAMKRAAIAEVATVEKMEQVVLGGVVLNDLTSTAKISVADSPPIRFYHRDNAQSQTQMERISRKTVWTYARLLDQLSPSLLHSPIRWLRHTATLHRYSRHVHGSWFAGARLIERPLARMLARMTVPLGWAVNRRTPKPRVVEIPVFAAASAEDLPDLRVRGHRP